MHAFSVRPVEAIARTLLGTPLLALLALPPAHAAVLEEVVVTAQKREQSLQDVPVSVGAVLGESIQAQGLRELEELTAQVPNVTISESAIGDKLFIRGIGSGINAGFEQSVGTFVDGIYHGRSLQSRSQFLDVERVEILRGPQSTFFGNNTIAGAINITTRKPTDDFEGYATALYEPDHGEHNVEVAMGGPVSDTLAVRGAARFGGISGWVQNASFDDEPDEENRVGRLTAVWTPNDRFDATGKVQIGSFEVDGRTLQNIECPPTGAAPAGACALTLAFLPGFEDAFDERKQVGGAPPPAFLGAVTVLGSAEAGIPVPPPNPVFARQDHADLATRDYALTMNYDVGGHTLTSVTGFTGYDFDMQQQSDFAPVPLLSLHQNEKFDQYSQELRLTSPLGGRFDYLAGLYWQTSDLRVAERGDFYLAPPFFAPAASFNPLLGGDTTGMGRTPATIAAFALEHEQDEETFSGFFSLTWNVVDYLRLTVGGRYTHVDKDMDRSQVFIDSAPGVTAQCPPEPFASAIGCIAGSPFLFSAPNPPNPIGAFGWRDGNLSLSRSDEDFAPSVTLEWDATEDILTYASFAQGFKAGGFDERNLFLDPVTGQFDPEEVDAWEIGAKTRWLDGSLQINVAAFRSEYENLQVSTFDGVVNFLVNNAASAVSQGFELDGRWAVTENFRLALAVSYLDAYWDSFEDAQCTAPQFLAAQGGDFSQCSINARGLLVQDLTDQDLLMAPAWSGHFFAEYVWPLPHDLAFVTQLNVSWEDDQFLAADNDPAVMQELYAKVDARFALGDRDGTWEIAIVGKNLNDELTAHHGEDQPLQSSLSYFKLTDRPRSIAFQASYRW